MHRTLSLLVIGVLAFALAACGQPVEAPDDEVVTAPETPDPEATEPTPEPDPAPDDEANGEPAGTRSITAFFVRDDPDRVAVEPETHELDEPTVGVARAAMELLAAGDTRDPHLSTLVPEGTEVLGTNIDGDVLIVDFSEEVRHGIGGTMGESALAAQITHTGAQFDGVERVLVWVEGEPIEELWGHIDWSEPMEPPPYSLSPIIFEHPRWGDEVNPGTLTARGISLTFEATVELRLYDPAGSLVEDTFTTAVQPDIDRHGPWEHTFDTRLDQPGRWRIEAEAPDASGGAEGPGPFITSVEFDVTG